MRITPVTVSEMVDTTCALHPLELLLEAGNAPLTCD